MVLSSAAQESTWLRQLSEVLGKPPQGPTVVYEDNQATIAISKNPLFHSRAKHIDIRHHYVREQVSNAKIKLKYCPTLDMIADMLKKGLNKGQFIKLRQQTGMYELQSH